MLTIQKFAELAGTTRRTLIFYDQKDLFKPKRVADNGYRYYDYDQLYRATFILELRRLGLSISEIKALNDSRDQSALNDRLTSILSQINQRIDNLNLLRSTLDARFNQPTSSESVVKNHPFITTGAAQLFCQSKQSVACTEEEIAEIYADFYQRLGKLKLMNKKDSGFLTQLPKSDANLYPTASFCILKAITADTDTGNLPRLSKPAGKFVAINTTNDTKNICIGLQILAEYITNHHLKINQELWQMNRDEAFTSKGASNLVCLQYQIQP